jgi:hypothetical protein
MFVTNSKGLVFSTLMVLTATVLFGGCATVKPMPLSGETKTLDLSKETVAIFTVKTSNPFKPGYQPHVSYVHVRQNGGQEKKETFSFSVNDAYSKVENQYDEYLVSISLPPGKYKLRHIGGTSGVFPVHGNFAVPVFADVELKPNKLVYLGRVEATLRERKNDSEIRGGSPIPLIDQAVTGFGKGTFDINIYDNYDKDVALFKQIYPVLKSYSVEKAVLPPWKRPTEEEMK